MIITSRKMIIAMRMGTIPQQAIPDLLGLVDAISKCLLAMLANSVAASTFDSMLSMAP